MKPLKLEKNRNSLGVYCTHKDCLKQYNVNNIKRCKHPENQKYKCLVKVAGKTKVHYPATRNYTEALQSSIEFKEQIRGGVYVPTKKDTTISPSHLSLLEAAEIYMDFVSDINVPAQLKNNFTQKHINQVKFHIQQFFTVLRSNKIEPRNTRILDLDDEVVGHWYNYLIDHYSSGSWNTIKRIMAAWINYFRKEEIIEMRNPFTRVKIRAVKKKIESITKEEFYGVLDAIENKSSKEQLNDKRGSVKNRYREYLTPFYQLLLYSGLRRMEAVTLKWSNLFVSHKTGKLMFAVKNLKVERQKQDDYAPKYVPVYPQLMEFLIELGYEEKIGTNEYIIEPERTCNENTMMIQLTKSWTHYFKQAFPDRPNKPLKHLRKTYLSYLNLEVGDDMNKLSSHGGLKVLEDHYLDAEVTTRGANMRMF